MPRIPYIDPASVSESEIRGLTVEKYGERLTLADSDRLRAREKAALTYTITSAGSSEIAADATVATKDVS